MVATSSGRNGNIKQHNKIARNYLTWSSDRETHHYKSRRTRHLSDRKHINLPKQRHGDNEAVSQLIIDAGYQAKEHEIDIIVPGIQVNDVEQQAPARVTLHLHGDSSVSDCSDSPPCSPRSLSPRRVCDRDSPLVSHSERSSSNELSDFSD